MKTIVALARMAIALGRATTAVAAELVAPDLVELPWASIAVAGLIALWGGMAATLGRLATAQERLPIAFVIAKDLFASATVGAGFYGVGASYQWGVWQLAVVLLVAGYGGSRVLDAALDKLLDMIRGAKGGEQ